MNLDFQKIAAAFLKAAVIFVSLLIFYTAYADVPPGFDDLDTTEETMVSVYYMWKPVGDVLARFDDEDIEFVHPEKLQKLIPNLKSNVNLSKYFSKKLKTNYDLVCKPKQKTNCGYINANSVSVIFDRNTYRVYVFVNSKYLLSGTREMAKYFSTPNLPFGGQSSFDFNYSYSNENRILESVNETSFNLENKSTLTKGKYNMALDSGFSRSQIGTISSNSFYMSDFTIGVQNKNHVTSLGYQQTYGDLLIPSTPFFGVSVNSDQTLLRNPNVLYGTPILLSFNGFSVVDIYRFGKLVSTSRYMPGSHYLDTSSLPAGAYPIKVVTTGPDGIKTEREYYYVKATSIPALGHPVYGLSVGYLLGDTSYTIFPSIGKYSVLQAEYLKRLKGPYAVGVNFFSTPHVSLLDFSSSVIGRFGSVSPYYMLATDGDRGFGVVANGAHYGVGYSANFRRIISHAQARSKNTDPINKDVSHLNSSISSGIGFRLGKWVTGLSYAYIYSDDKKWGHQVEMTLSRNYNPVSDLELELSFEAVHDPDGYGANATLQINFSHGDFSHRFYTSSKYSYSGSGGESISEPPFAYSGGWSKVLEGGTNVSLGTNVSYSSSKSIGALAGYNSSKVSVSAGAGHSVSATGVSNQVNSSLKTSMVFGGGSYAFSGSNVSAGVLVRVHAPANALFTNNYQKNSKHFRGGEWSFIPALEYVIQKVAISSAGDQAYYIADAEQEFTFYPGSIYTMDLVAKPVYMLVTNFVLPDGEPVGVREIRGGVEYSETDEDGAAQLDLFEGSKLQLIDARGNVCDVDTKGIPVEDGMAFEDELICVPSGKIELPGASSGDEDANGDEDTGDEDWDDEDWGDEDEYLDDEEEPAAEVTEAPDAANHKAIENHAADESADAEHDSSADESDHEANAHDSAEHNVDHNASPEPEAEDKAKDHADHKAEAKPAEKSAGESGASEK